MLAFYERYGAASIDAGVLLRWLWRCDHKCLVAEHIHARSRVRASATTERGGIGWLFSSCQRRWKSGRGLCTTRPSSSMPASPRLASSRRRRPEIRAFVDGGIGGGLATVAEEEHNFVKAVDSINKHIKLFNRHADKIGVCSSVGELEQCKAEGKVGFVLHFQDTRPIETDLDYLKVFHTARPAGAAADLQHPELRGQRVLRAARRRAEQLRPRGGEGVQPAGSADRSVPLRVRHLLGCHPAHPQAPCPHPRGRVRPVPCDGPKQARRDHQGRGGHRRGHRDRLLRPSGQAQRRDPRGPSGRRGRRHRPHRSRGQAGGSRPCRDRFRPQQLLRENPRAAPLLEHPQLPADSGPMSSAWGRWTGTIPGRSGWSPTPR